MRWLFYHLPMFITDILSDCWIEEFYPEKEGGAK